MLLKVASRPFLCADAISSRIKLNRTEATLNCSAGFMNVKLCFLQEFFGIVYTDYDRLVHNTIMYWGGFFERNYGRRPQLNLRSRAPVPGRHWSGCTPRPIVFEHRALDLRLTWGLLPHKIPFKNQLLYCMCNHRVQLFEHFWKNREPWPWNW